MSPLIPFLPTFQTLRRTRDPHPPLENEIFPIVTHVTKYTSLERVMSFNVHATHGPNIQVRQKHRVATTSPPRPVLPTYIPIRVTTTLLDLLDTYVLVPAS